MSSVPLIVSAAVAGTAGAAAWGAVAPWSELFGPTVRHTAANTVALTFDDGPNPAVTPHLLDLFERHSIHATFFLIGRFARACPALVREIAQRGHVLGNHTETHANLIFKSRAGLHDELSRCQDAVADATGGHGPRWMRPPYGYRSPMLDAEVRRAGMRGIVMWSKICWDWKPQPAQRLIQRLADVARPGASRGALIVLHDGDHRGLGGDRQHVVAALEYWLPRWRDANLKFVTIDDVAHAAPVAPHI